MNVRDSLFTVRIEPALRMLVKNPAYGLSWLARRHDLTEAELRAWLDTFNGGSKTLTGARIDAVKAEVGAISSGTRPAPAMAPAAPPAAPSSPPAHPAAKPAAPVETAAATPQRPWLDGRRFRGGAFARWRPVLVDLLEEGRMVSEVCAQHGASASALRLFLANWFGRAANAKPAAMREFLVWADAQQGGTPPPPVARKATPAGAVSETWNRWRADAIAALVAMGTKNRQATVQVDAAIAELRGEDCETGELVKRALRQVAPAVPAAAPAAVPAVPAGTAFYKWGGAVFKIEIVTRITPMPAGTEVPS